MWVRFLPRLPEKSRRPNCETAFSPEKENCVANKKKPARKNAITRFYRETVGELRKVTWPTRQEAINLTIVVLFVTFGMSAFLGLLDYLFSRLFVVILGL
ncbi:MAG: preprotein translocase subunit SecE [Chloroflexi bacterium]|nr:preprotein translocase subunit SecE [Chloroflexota bacterium]